MSHVNVNKQNILNTENLVLVDRQQDYIYEKCFIVKLTALVRIWT